MGLSDDDRFKQLVQGLQFENASSTSEEALGPALSHVKRLIVSSGMKIEDIRSWQGIIETNATVYKTLEIGEYPETLFGDVALIGAEAFGKFKHFTVYAPELPTDLAYRILALGHADYFSRANLHAALCTSEMQIARAVYERERSNSLQAPSKLSDAFYWLATAKTLCWIFAYVSFYAAIRARVPSMLLATIAVLPFWLKAFYGTRPLQTGLENAKTRIVAANDVVAPIYAVLLLMSLAFAPVAIVWFTSAALSIDAACFVSAWIAKPLVHYRQHLPPMLR